MKRTWLRRRTKPRRSDRVRDPEFLAWVHTLPCAARALSPCYGPIEADHQGWRPFGRKADDVTAVPLCLLHHRQRTDFSGPFRAWSREDMRIWLRANVEETQAAWERRAA